MVAGKRQQLKIECQAVKADGSSRYWTLIGSKGLQYENACGNGFMDEPREGLEVHNCDSLMTSVSPGTVDGDEASRSLLNAQSEH